MDGLTNYAVDDFQDLPFDVSRHAEALKSFTALNMAAQSIRPALRARDLVLIRVPSCKFRIGVTGNPAVQDSMENRAASVAFEMICQAADTREAENIRGEVERYFLRHYPGRTLSAKREAEEETPTGCYVYIACYPPGD